MQWLTQGQASRPWQNDAALSPAAWDSTEIVAFSFFLAQRKYVAAPSSFAVTLHPRAQTRLTGGGCREAGGGERPSGVSESVLFSRAWKSR